MHEYSIVQALLERVDAAARENRATAVHRIQIQIGELSGVEPELLREAFSIARTHTLSSRARLDIVPVVACWSCPRCERELASGERLRCPRCQVPARLANGGEIVLERLEMEVRDV